GDGGVGPIPSITRHFFVGLLGPRMPLLPRRFLDDRTGRNATRFKKESVSHPTDRLHICNDRYTYEAMDVSCQAIYIVINKKFGGLEYGDGPPPRLRHESGA